MTQLMTVYKVIQQQILTFKTLMYLCSSPWRSQLTGVKRVLTVANFSAGWLRLLVIVFFLSREFVKLDFLKKMRHLSHWGMYSAFTLQVERLSLPQMTRQGLLRWEWNSGYIIIRLIITLGGRCGANNIRQDIYPLKLTPHQTSSVSSH